MSNGKIRSELTLATREFQEATIAHRDDKGDGTKAVRLDTAWSRVTFLTTLSDLVERERERAVHSISLLKERLKADPDSAEAKAELDAGEKRLALMDRMLSP